MFVKSAVKGTKERLVDRINLPQHYRREIYGPLKTMFCKICSFLYIIFNAYIIGGAFEALTFQKKVN